jgi:hypothetical protein
MRTLLRLIAVLSLSVGLLAQAPGEPFQPVATMKQLMVEIVYPAANDLLLSVNRGGPGNDSEWAAVKRNAMTLAESGNLLIVRNRAAAWVADARALIASGTSAYQAAEARDGKALAAVAERIDASCTACHKHFRPSIFPPGR